MGNTWKENCIGKDQGVMPSPSKDSSFIAVQSTLPSLTRSFARCCAPLLTRIKALASLKRRHPRCMSVARDELVMDCRDGSSSHGSDRLKKRLVDQGRIVDEPFAKGCMEFDQRLRRRTLRRSK